MKIITRYIVNEISFSTIIGFFVFTFFLIMNSLFVLSDLFVKYGVDFISILKLLFLLLPSTVAITVPMAFLVGVLLTYSRLVQDNEYIAMQTSGINILKITNPTINLSIFIMFIMIFFNNYVLPAANFSYKKLYYEIVKKRATILIQEHAFIDDFDNYIFYIGDKDSKSDLLKNIIVFVKSEVTEKNPPKLILAKNGEIMTDEDTLRIALKLNSGIIQIGSYLTPTKMNQAYFDTNIIDLDIKGVLRKNQNPNELKGTREMTAEELIAEIKKGDKSKQDKNWLYIELYKKFSIPFAAVAFAIIGLPLGLLTKKGGRIAAISFSIVLIFIYYVFLSFGQYYGYEGKMNHFFAVWMPNFFMLIAGFVLFIILLFPYLKIKFRKPK